MNRLRVLSIVGIMAVLLGADRLCLLQKARCNLLALGVVARPAYNLSLEGCSEHILNGAAFSSALRGEIDQAYRYLGLARAKDPTYPPAHVTTGYLLLIADDYESAVEEWQSIGAIGCILRLGEQYLSERRWDRAVVAFTAARALEPSSEEISLKLARALLREDRDPTSTIGLLTEIIAAKPSECEAYGMLGTACRNGGDLAQARTWYIEAVRVCPGDAGTWLDLGRFLLLWDNNTEAALPAVQTTLALDPNSAEGRVLLGIYSYRHGDLTGALNEVRRGIDLDPGGGWFYVVLGDIYRDLGQRLAARTAYERAIELGSEVEYARRQLQALDQ